ncbi:hypothetical protein [Paractinoplanes rishiriensis]|uniref:DUF2637 domain-containing protein n=1 Tax=Paractinoplanes rishiriensis TaxID=1050105 RepID=A0A919MTA7_9ACTN|nr:hypothetical protein [Actinoplanes rishiriensis]GIE94059.1 hypothetical protein Ari01nite_15240 [Actinoplanes rishiriensis]
MTTNSHPPTTEPGLADRLERVALFLILGAVAILAGKVAFFRVVGWTMENSPDETPYEAGWTNGIITELLPIGALLYIRHQKRHGRKPGSLAWSALLGGFLFSLVAQLAQAEPTAFGWIVAGLPSAAFMALSKLVVSMRPAQHAVEVSAANSQTGAVIAPVVTAPVAEAAEPDGSRTRKTKPEPSPMPATRHAAATSKSSEPSAAARRRSLPATLTRKDQVVAAAKALGPGASVEAIASKAGVSVSTVRRHLPPVNQPIGQPKMPGQAVVLSGDVALSAA